MTWARIPSAPEVLFLLFFPLRTHLKVRKRGGRLTSSSSGRVPHAPDTSASAAAEGRPAGSMKTSTQKRGKKGGGGPEVGRGKEGKLLGWRRGSGKLGFSS